MVAKKGFRANKRLREPFGKRAARFFRKTRRPAVAVIMIAAAVFAARWARREALTAPYLAIRAVNVTGAQRVPREDVVRLSGLMGRNILSFRAGDVAAGIRRNPWIETATVKRRFPAAVDIEVRERRAAALIRLDELYVMDADGVIFKKLSGEDGLDLPVITGFTKESVSGGRAGYALLELLAVLRGRRGFNLSGVSEIHFDPTFGFSVYTLDEGVRLDVGMDAFEEKLSSFEKVWKARGGSLEGVEAMDLNNAHRVVVRFGTDVIKERGDANGKKG